MFHHNLTSYQKRLLESIDIPVEYKHKLANFWGERYNKGILGHIKLKKEEKEEVIKEKQGDHPSRTTFTAWAFILLMIGHLIVPEEEFFATATFIFLVFQWILAGVFSSAAGFLFSFAFFSYVVARYPPKAFLLTVEREDTGEIETLHAPELLTWVLCSPYMVLLFGQHKRITRTFAILRFTVVVLLFGMIQEWATAWAIFVSRFIFIMACTFLKRVMLYYIQALP